MSNKEPQEPRDALTPETRDLHHALISLQEELEAIDWYRQRSDTAGDPQLRNILIHNMREEMEHAAMLLEWLRRNDSDFSHQLRSYLFTTAPIAEREEDKPERPSAIAAPTIGTLRE